LYEDPNFLVITERDLQGGQHRNPEGEKFFTTSFFHHPFELRQEVIGAGFGLEALLALRVLATRL
jgi:hypothetical protein